MAIATDFFDLELYAIYKAISEQVGREAWKIVWRSGEIMFDELNSTLDLKGEKDVFSALRRIADYLERAGYIEKINFHKIAEDLIEYEMFNPSIGPGASRLIKEGAVPPHLSTSLLFAALKHYGLRAEMVEEEPSFLPDKRVIERWKLTHDKG